jgi:hypothetical protein
MSPIVRQYYRVPREDRAVDIRPPAAELPALVERNRRLAASWNFEFAGRPFQEFRAAARAEIMALARSYAERWGFAAETDWAEPAPIIATGHQPIPFHPGVWIKNFLAGSLAAGVGGAALNLAIDNDEARGQVYRLPVRGGQSQGHEWEAQGILVKGATWPARDVPRGEVAVVEVPYARPQPGVAYEEPLPLKRAPGTSWPARGEAAAFSGGGLPSGRMGPIRPYMGPEELELPPHELLVTMSLPLGSMNDAWHDWSTIWAGWAYSAGSPGESILLARHWLEERLGLRNLELPVSWLVDGDAFRLFVAEMVRRREEFFAAYNDSLAEYRRVYRERSRAQPLPDLARDGVRVELPFWVWRGGEPRRRLWVEPADAPPAPADDKRAPRAGRLSGLTLWAEHEVVGTFSDGDIADARRAAARLAEFRRAGWKIRPRALALTLFVRMAVGDAFIHGLGGALYDKITDEVFGRLLGVQAPEIILASCTVRLPIEPYPSTAKDLAAARRLVRDWRFNPDRLLAPATRCRPDAAPLMEEKRRLIGHREPTREGRRRAWQRIRGINEALAAMDSEGPRAAAERLARVERELKWNAILQDRQYPFCFYPPEELAGFYRDATRI